MKKYGTRILSILMIVASIVVFCTFHSSASDSNIFYSDLFYGYSSSYLRSQYLRDYASENSALMSDIFNAYIDSGDSVWMTIKTGLSAATNLNEFIQLVSDGFGNTDYNYNNALDKANEEFAKKLLSDSSYNSQISLYGTSKKVAKKLKDLTSLYEKVRGEIDWQHMTGWEIVDHYATYLSDLGVYEDTPYSIPVFRDVLPELKKLSSAFDVGSKVLEGAGAFSLALMIEEIRMDIIDEIIDNSEPGTYLYDGMTRLKTQLRNGWKSYLIDNYITETALNELTDVLVKSATSGSTMYGLVTAILKVASWITFDVIMNVPTLEDCLVQQTLTNYASGLYSALVSKQVCFGSQFMSDDILGYEGLFSAYSAAVNAGLDASENLTIDSNKDDLTHLKNQNKSFNYDSYIEDIISTISNTQINDLNYRPLTDWNLLSSTQFLAASDLIEPNAVYTFNGAIQGNVTLTGNDPLLTNCDPLVINESLNCNLLKLNENRIVVNGDLTVSSLDMQNERDYLLVNGDCEVTGDGGSTLTAGTIELKGNFRQNSSTFKSPVYMEKDTHKTIFSGNQEQTVFFGYPNGNGFSTLVSLNTSKKGITFTSPVRVTTLFNHNQNNFTLYNNGSGSIFVDYDGDGLKDNVDPYPTLKPGSASDFIISDLEPQLYTGESVTAPFTVTCQNEELVEGRHYEVAYQNNDKPGTATIVITGIDNFDGTIETTFEIYCDHTPGDWVVVQAATTMEEGLREQYCTICGEMVASEVIEKLPPKAVEIAGFDSNQERSVDYKTTITFHSNLDESVEDGEVHWYVNGKDSGTGKDFTVSDATSTYTVQSKVIKDGKVIAESGIETVTVKSSFFQRIIAFIKRIFNRKAFIIDQR